MLCSRISEKIIGSLYRQQNLKKKNDLFECIEDLTEKKVVSPEISSSLHLIRIFANKARHGAESAIFIDEDAILTIEALLRLLVWYDSRKRTDNSKDFEDEKK